MKIEELFLYKMIQSLKLVAADFDLQISSLPSYVDIPDEIVSIFDEALVLFDQVIAADLVNKEQIEAVYMVNNKFEKINSDRETDLWTIQAMKEEKVWSDLRETAKFALGTFGENSDVPDLQWITYVRSNNKPI